MLRTLILAFLCIRIVNASVACYDCFGTSASAGSICSTDRVVACPERCGMSIAANGAWTSGCSNATSANLKSEIKCEYSATDGVTSCACSANLCNGIESSISELTSVWKSAGVTVHFILPSKMEVECFQCGVVVLDGVAPFNVSCDPSHTCRGDYCVTKRGPQPHSYCGSSWEGAPTAGCTKSPTEPDVCVCMESLCNAVFDAVPGVPTTTTQSAPTTSGIICKNGKFAPNNEATQMGQKLRDKIMGMMGSAVNVESFREGIQDHICNYSPSQ